MRIMVPNRLLYPIMLIRIFILAWLIAFPQHGAGSAMSIDQASQREKERIAADNNGYQSLSQSRSTAISSMGPHRKILLGLRGNGAGRRSTEIAKGLNGGREEGFVGELGTGRPGLIRSLSGGGEVINREISIDGRGLRNRSAHYGTKMMRTKRSKLLSRYNNGCTSRDISISQSRDAANSAGIPRFVVQIVNTCVAGCVRDVHVTCGWFASAGTINPRVFRRVAYDDCVVNAGGVLPAEAIVRFTYSNSFMYPLSFKSAVFC